MSDLGLPTTHMAAQGLFHTASDAVMETISSGPHKGRTVYGVCGTCGRRVPLYRIKTAIGPGPLVMLAHTGQTHDAHAGRGWKYTTLQGDI